MAAAAAAASRKRPAPEEARSPAAVAAVASSRKRPAPEEARPPVAAAKKQARYNFSKIADYELLDSIGEGSFGVVMRGRHRRTGEKVAIKWIRPTSSGAPDLKAVVREGGCLGKCRGHPYVVQIKDVASNEATGDLYLIMEFVGPCLRDWLTRPIPEYAARGFMRQLFSAAARMHAAPMIHRDIKPENILVGGLGGVLKICDFGCATPANPPGAPYPEPRVGTLQYSSPEQLMGDRCYGTAVDMWALGCVMAELLIGAPLFAADTEEGMLKQIEELRDGIAAVGVEAIDELLELSPAGREVLAGLLSFEPGERLTAKEALEHRWFTEEASPAAAKSEFPGFVPLFSAA